MNNSPSIITIKKKIQNAIKLLTERARSVNTYKGTIKNGNNKNIANIRTDILLTINFQLNFNAEIIPTSGLNVIIAGAIPKNNERKTLIPNNK